MRPKKAPSPPRAPTPLRALYEGRPAHAALALEEGRPAAVHALAPLAAAAAARPRGARWTVATDADGAAWTWRPRDAPAHLFRAEVAALRVDAAARAWRGRALDLAARHARRAAERRVGGRRVDSPEGRRPPAEADRWWPAD